MLGKIRKVGWKYSIAILFNRVVPKWLFRMRRYVVYQMDVSQAQTALANDNAVAKLQLAACRNDVETAAVEQLTWFRREYSSGMSWAYQAVLSGQLAGGFWAAEEVFDEDELGVRLRLGSHQAWLFAAMVSNEVRGTGIYSHLLPFVIDDVAKRGFQQVLLAVNPDNLRSNSIHQRWAERQLGSVVAIRLLKFTLCFSGRQFKQNKTISWNSTSNPIVLRLQSTDAD